MEVEKLEIFRIAIEVSIKVHKLSLEKLPKHEMYETGSQIRRSSKSARSNIVEGYGRRKYSSDWIRFLIYAQTSNDETLDHLNTLFETGSLEDEVLYLELKDLIDKLGRKLNLFRKRIEGK
jgi:four helix bundle protein